MSLDRSKRSIHFIQDRTSEDRLRDIDLHMRWTKLMNEKFVRYCIFSLVREKTYYWTSCAGWLKLLFGLIQLIRRERGLFDPFGTGHTAELVRVLQC